MPESTTDYDVFKKHEANRDVAEANVRGLIASISKKNMLHVRPILVDKDFNVIDGNHRLEAARRMQIPIYFEIDTNLQTEDMYLINSAQKNWSLSDYLNYYVHQKNENYIKLNDFLVKEDLPLNLSFSLLNGLRHGSFFKDFREGKYQFPNETELQEALDKRQKILWTIDYIKKKTSGQKLYLSRVAFFNALVEFFNIKTFDYSVFMNKLQYKLDLIRPCTKYSDYVRIFKDIYNWKNQNPLEK